MFSLLVEGTVLSHSTATINRVRQHFSSIWEKFCFPASSTFHPADLLRPDGVWSASPVTEYLMMNSLVMLSKEFKFLKHNAVENKHPAGKIRR